MSTKDVTVSCPCCGASLVIDVLTQTVLKHVPAEGSGEGGRWKGANETVRGRLDRAGDAMDAALDKERAREKDLDALFDQAREKVKRRRDRVDED